MNLATLVTLAVVTLVIGFAVCRVYRMIRDNDMCYACSSDCANCGRCNRINCSVKKE